MNIDITTPALLFPAITLLMLAHTNRFLALANLVRQFRALYDEKPDDRVFKQIENFQKRLNILKYTQFVSVLSFLFCVICMFIFFLNKMLLADITFAISLLLMMASLILSLWEIYLSVDALKVELGDIDRERKLSK
ncbi:MAG: DUF2721 domain-containing protein [Caldicoprobacterales bacterium]|jgi:hypothetical protein|nr:DUF2721 domain-containing protein [Clostridia bacterium]MDI9511788.1 DUF2721 domain-containing protein [Bacillota bacterium]